MKKQTITRVLAMVLCLVMLFLAGCAAAPADNGTAAEGEGKVKETMNIYGVGSKLISYDYDGSHKSLRLTHDRLVEKNYKEGKLLELVPGLATEWNWIDDTTLEMKLREGVKFHNGEDFCADDVAFTFNDCVLTHSQASKMSMLNHVEAVDDYTVRFILNQYHADFLYMLSEEMYSIVNREAVEADELEGAYIGTGPYYVQEFVQSDYEDVERFDDYWGEPGITKHFHIRSIPETSTAMIALENGEMDAITFDVVDMPYIEANPDLEARIVPNLALYFAFNMTKGPGQDKNLRMAVAYCMNPEDYLASVDPGYSIAHNTMWGINSFGYDDSIPAYGHDLEKAKEYLAKSEYKEFTVTISSGISYIAEILQANCAEIGLTVNINVLDSAAVTATTKFDVAEHEAYLGTFSMNLNGDDCRRLFYPGSNVNKAILTDEKIIDLIDKAASEKDEQARIEMYHEIQRINHEECYYLPLCLAAETTAYNNHIQGLLFETRGRHDFSHAYMLEQ